MLGGTRKAANDDSNTSTRKWEGEPAAAKSYSDENIASLDKDRKHEAETLLPSISTDE